MAYPSTTDTFSNPQGTTLVATDDHAAQHRTEGSAIVSLENKVGLGSGTPKLDYALIGSGNGTSLWGTAWNNATFGTPQITGGTVSNSIISTPTVTLGTGNTGDIYYRSSGGSLSALPIGTVSQYLTTNGTAPSWGTISSEPSDGWTASGGTWAYSSGSVVTINADLSVWMNKGDRIKFTQGGTVEYFNLVGYGVSSGTTTGTILGDAGTPIANTAISSVYFSKKVNPLGFPGWFNYTTTFAGFSTNPTITSRYSILGPECTIEQVWATPQGTSNATTKTFTLPLAAAKTVEVSSLVGVHDNGLYLQNPGHIKLSSGSIIADVYKGLVELTWTGSGACPWQAPMFSYEY